MAKKKTRTTQTDTTQTNAFPWGLIIIVAAIAASALVVTLLFPTIQSMSPTNIFEFVGGPSPIQAPEVDPATEPQPLDNPSPQSPPSTESTKTEIQPESDKPSNQSGAPPSEPGPQLKNE